MSAQVSTTPAARGIRTADVIRRASQLVVAILIYGLVLFLAAGRTDWPAAWWFIGLNFLLVLFGGTLLLLRNPSVIAARSHVRSDIETWDKWVSILVSIGMLACLLVPGLDHRFSWTSAFPAWLQVGGFVLLGLGYSVVVWAMLNNPFFEGGVRIQDDRGQTVASAGPYRLVRHPGYVGMILQYIGTPLALASTWGLIAGAVTGAIFVLRTALEDRTLQLKLPGYADFATRTRFRLLPGIW